MAKKKSKIKKFLKKIAPLAIAGLGAAALGRRRKNQANVEMDLPVSRVDGRDFGPYSKQPTFITPRMMTPQDMANDQMFQNVEMMKKGGRVGCGKAKRGFGRAMKGKK
jgi:hypothetical protein